jgi:plastocyanin
MAKVCPMGGCKEKEGMCVHDKMMLVIIVIGLVFAGWWFLRDGNKQIVTPATDNGAPVTVKTNIEQTPATPTQTLTVTYDGKSFSPSTITINKGDSITFINNNSDGMSVASNPHPTHTIYPEFDQYKTSERGQKEFTFTFTKIGSWGYHNHVNPSAVGTVIVK